MLRAMVALALVAGAGQDDEKGFENIFNGTSFEGLKFHAERGEPAASWRAEGGVLRCLGDVQGYAYTEKKYKDFTLRFDGRFVRPPDLKDDSKFAGDTGTLLWVGGEHKIWPRSLAVQGMNRQAGYIYVYGAGSREKNKFAYDDAARAKAVKPVGEWNAVEIAARKGTVVVTINGVKVTTVTSHEFTEAGHIAFQSENGEVHWRYIRVRPE